MTIILKPSERYFEVGKTYGIRGKPGWTAVVEETIGEGRRYPIIAKLYDANGHFYCRSSYTLNGHYLRDSSKGQLDLMMIGEL